MEGFWIKPQSGQNLGGVLVAGVGIFYSSTRVPLGNVPNPQMLIRGSSKLPAILKGIKRSQDRKENKNLRNMCPAYRGGWMRLGRVDAL